MVDIKNFKIIQKLKTDDLGFKLLIGMFFWICLSFFLHFRQVWVEIPQLNSKAHGDIMAQVRFDYPDDEKTIIQKQKNISGIRSIYFIDSKEIKQKRTDLEQYLIQNQRWKTIPAISYESICEIADLFELVLMEGRFTDAITLKIMKKFKINTQDYLALNLSDAESFTLPKGYFSLLAKKAADNLKVSDEIINFMTEYFEKNDYMLRVDQSMLRKIKKHIEANIPQQYSSANAGALIIGSNEKVTSRHIAMIQAMKDALSRKIRLFHPLALTGNFLIAFIVILLSFLYFKIEQPKLFKPLKQVSLIVTILLLTLLFAKTAEYMLLKSSPAVLKAVQYPIIVPFAALLFSILFNIRISFFFSILLSIALSVALAVEHAGFLIVNAVGSIIVIISSRCLRKRTEVFGVCVKSMSGIAGVLVSMFFISNRMFSLILLSNLIWSFLELLLIGILVVGLLPVLEAFFDVLTDITLMEYMDPNNELLRRLTHEIPGSYQHSLVLGNLAEAAAHEIKANALFCRVATLYHDIGKLNNPNYFIENQGTGVNIHQLLTPLESAQVIISHVIEGEMLGQKYRLPKKIIEVIKQHHGTTLVYYFFRKEEEMKGKDIDQTQFRYPGPKPQTKEAAIIMIADSVEAASRSLEKISEKIFGALVNRIVKEKAEDGQFDDCSLTFEELKIIKRSIVKTLMLTRHVRIKYPGKHEDKLNIYLEPFCLDKNV